MATTMARRTCAEGFASRFQCVAPSVLGTISEKMRIANVSPTVNAVTQGLPNRSWAVAPARVAPAVFEIVFSVRIAAIGSSTLSCTLSSHTPAHSPRSLSTAM